MIGNDYLGLRLCGSDDASVLGVKVGVVPPWGSPAPWDLPDETLLLPDIRSDADLDAAHAKLDALEANLPGRDISPREARDHQRGRVEVPAGETASASPLVGLAVAAALAVLGCGLVLWTR